MARCVLSDEDARYLAALAQSQALHDAAIQSQTLSQMSAFKEKIAAQQAQLQRQQEAQLKRELLGTGSNSTGKSGNSSTIENKSTNISTKRSSLGITPKKS